jgi:hypothetical protein
MEILSLFVFSRLKDHRKQPFAYPTDGAKLLWKIGPPIQIIRMFEDFLDFLEANPRVSGSPSIVRSSAHRNGIALRYNSYTMK